MIDDGLFLPMAEPIRMRLRNGLFYADVPTIGKIISATIEGKFAGIVPTAFKGYPYYALQIQDATNMFHVLFVPQASNLIYLVLSMCGEVFANVFIEGYINDDGRSRMRLYLDGKPAFPHYDVELPPIKRVRDGKGKPYHCLYGDRLKKIAQMIEMINKSNHIQPVCVKQHTSKIDHFL